MKARRDMMRLRYWRNLINMGQERLPKKVYDWELRKGRKGSWVRYTKELLMELGLGEYWMRQEAEKNKTKWNDIIQTRIHVREQKNGKGGWERARN